MQTNLLRMVALAILLVVAYTVSVADNARLVPVTPATFNVGGASMTIGRDGKVYFVTRPIVPPNVPENMFLLRLGLDGTGGFAGDIDYTCMNATANPDGYIGTANVHFMKRITLFDRNLHRVGAFIKLAGNDRYEAPIHVEAGPSGDFYAADQVRDRIVRFHPDGTRVATYVLPHVPDGALGVIRDFRVCEKAGTVYAITADGTLRCFSADLMAWKTDAVEKFRVDSHIRTDVNGYGLGGWDVDDAGILYTNDGWTGTIKRYDLAGKPLPDVALQLGDLKPVNDGKWPQHGYNTLRVWNGQVLLKRANDTELYQRYDMTTGKLLNAPQIADVTWTSATPDTDSHVSAFLPKPTIDTPVHSQPRPLRVLFIGNSQTDAVADIPEIVEDLSHTPGVMQAPIQADAVVIGGVGLKEIWVDGLAKRKIDIGHYDWVVLQEIIFRAETDKPTFEQYARLFGAEAAAQHSKVLLFVTGAVAANRPNHAIMYAANLEMAHELHCRIAGAGMSWLKAWAAQPDLDLHFTDRAHPNIKGYYLNACVLYSALTDRSPVGLDNYGLAPANAAFFQGIAWDQYADDRKAEK